MITLIIKGHMPEAYAALEKRGITAFTIEPHPKFAETIVRVVNDTPWEKLAKWFCEADGRSTHSKSTPGAFPDGTLLWYGPTYEPVKVTNFYEPDMSKAAPVPKGWDKVDTSTEDDVGFGSLGKDPTKDR